MLFLILLIILLSLMIPLLGITELHFHRSPKKGSVRIACIGDSITNGALIPGCFFRSYPSVLQNLLGSGYHVENYGLNDRTLQSSGDKPYTAEKEFRNSVSFSPDIVVILLGTNDTKPANWRSKDHFMEEYRKLLNTISMGKNPRILLCTPSWARDAMNSLSRLSNDSCAEMLPDIVDAVLELGEEYSLPVIDLYREFYERSDLLRYDGVHPNAAGAAHIAELVYNELIKYQ